MRILAIRGTNLASLAERFEIALTEPPLAGTGLFAITGDTGAGKSTILDALCLGLYGAYPRAATEGREKVFDPGNEEIQACDPRNILRRGAGEGFAQVDFVGQDGIAYRATWSVRRARGKASGRLQAVDRRLDRLDETANVASGIRDVDAAVTARTGLTYDQFRRTVLLAQGEFDTFLLASDNDRADLLEKITGTDIYTRISKRVHAEKEERDRRLREREAARQGIVTLSEEDRQGLTTGLEEGNKEAHSLDTAIQKVAAERARADLVARTRDSVAKTQAALAEAEIRWQAGEEQRTRLVALTTVEPLRGKVDGVSRARDHLAVCERSLEALQEAERSAAEDLERSRTATAEAKERADTALAEVTRFAPLWEEATKLDTRIATAALEFETDEAARTEAVASVARRQSIHEQQAKAHADLRDQYVRTETELAARAVHETLNTSRLRITELLTGHARLSRDLATCVGQQQQAEHEIATLEARSKVSAEEIAKTDAEIKRLDAALSEKGAALAAIGLEEAEAREEALGALDRILQRAQDAAIKRDRAAAEQEKAVVLRDAATLALTEAEKQALSHQQAFADARGKRAGLAQLVDLAEATASNHAKTLRADLVPDEPCPVCGASAHPYAAADSEPHALVVEIRRQRDALDAAMAGAQDRRREAEGRRATAIAEQTAAAEQIAHSTRLRDEALADLARLRPEIARLATPTRLPLDTVASADGAGARVTDFAVAVTAVESARAEVKALRQTETALRKDREALDARQRKQREAAKAAQVSGEESHTAIGAQRESLSGLTERRRSLDEQLASTCQQLLPFLSAAGMTGEDLARDSRSAETRIGSLADTFGQFRAALDELAARIASNDLELRDAHTALATSKVDEARCTQAAGKRQEKVEALRHQRAALFGDEPTDQHRTRFEAARQSSEDALRETDALRQAAEISRVTCGEAVKSERTKVVEARAHASAACAALAAQLAELQLDEAVGRELLAVAPEVRSALADAVATLDQERSTARVAAATRRADLDDLIAGETEGTPEAIEKLSLTQDQLATEKNALTERLAVERERLQLDTAARERLGSALQEIAELKTDLDVWRELHDAIGSSDGARFRRFAQGVTLRQLVSLANRQLGALNPRYQLRQAATSALALDVIDRDMGDEVRSPRGLSGGERFLVSLALALALSGLEGRQSFVDTLFIDEGFGSLDRDTLDVAIDALESLQGQGRKVGLITHVQAMIERIAVQVRVEKRGGGRSAIRMSNANTDTSGTWAISDNHKDPAAA